jgi:hypothetical protein
MDDQWMLFHGNARDYDDHCQGPTLTEQRATCTFIFVFSPVVAAVFGWVRREKLARINVL